MLLASLHLGRQRRYDLFLAFVPVALLCAMLASWAFPIPMYVAATGVAAVVGGALVALTLRHPPDDA